MHLLSFFAIQTETIDRMPKRPYPRWQRRHEAVLLWCIRNPGKKMKQCARKIGYSESQISRIVNSPDFQQHFEAARQIIEEEVSRSYVRRLAGAS